MALTLTPGRWLAAAVIGCLAASIIVVLEDPFSWNDPAVERRQLILRSRLHRDHAYLAASRLRQLQLRDSISRVAARDKRKDHVRTFFDPTLPPEVRSGIDWLLPRATRKAQTGRIPIDVAFVFDTISRIGGMEVGRGGATIAYVLPNGPEDRCTVIHRTHESSPRYRRSFVGQSIRTEAAVEQLLGPCAYYGVFGMPGPIIGKWLEERGLLFAMDGSWERTAPPVSGGRDLYYYAYHSGVGWGNLNMLSPQGASCAIGKAADCEPLFLSSVPGARKPVWSGMILHQFSRSPRLGGRESVILAEMVRTLGREKFAAFWTSSDSVSGAFQKAAGEPLGEWTSRWANQMYEPSEVGPRMPGWTAVTSFLLIALGLLIAIRVSSHRQFV
jgi:hypothetical protein